jgi:hypothetical protein
VAPATNIGDTGVTIRLAKVDKPLSGPGEQLRGVRARTGRSSNLAGRSTTFRGKIGLRNRTIDVLMATEKQCAFFKSLYDEESERAKILAEHSKNNLGLATLYSAFIIFVMDKQQSTDLTALHKGFFIAAIASMLAAFSLSLWATQIANYEAVTEPADIFASFKDSPPSDEDFFDDRIVDWVFRESSGWFWGIIAAAACR